MPLEVSKKRRVLSGMRPTGKLHLGNLVGALNNWVKLQSQYDCFHFIADWHALTSDFADPSKIKEYRFEMMIDWLAAGLDPKKSVMFVQSAVPQHAELHLIISMITPLGWLERVPSYKEQRENLTDRDLGNYASLGYPVFSYHKIYSPEETIQTVNRECRTAGIGCVECKQWMSQHLIESLSPLLLRRKEYESRESDILDIMEEGNRKARKEAESTMEE